MKTLKETTLGQATVRLVETKDGYAGIVIGGNGKTATIHGEDRDDLWRRLCDEAAKINIRSSNGKTQAVDWAAGKQTVGWPQSLPITSGAEYQIEGLGADTSSIQFVRVKSPPSDLVGAAQLLIENDCQNQLDLLVDSASKPQSSTASTERGSD